MPRIIVVLRMGYRNLQVSHIGDTCTFYAAAISLTPLPHLYVLVPKAIRVTYMRHLYVFCMHKLPRARGVTDMWHLLRQRVCVSQICDTYTLP